MASMPAVINRMMAGSATLAALSLGFALCFAPAASAQDHRDFDHGRKLDAGTVIPVRTDETINSNHADHHIYHGVVAEDVRSDSGRLVIPRGSPVELTVRVMQDRNLRLDLESVTIHGERYMVETNPKHVEAHNQYGVVSGIVGAISGGQVQGREVRIPNGAVLHFRLEQPLFVGHEHRGEY